MKRFSTAILLGLVMVLAITIGFAQKPAIKVEGMSIDRLVALGYPNPNAWDNTSSGLNQVGLGTRVWISGWDVSGDTTYKPAANYLWTLTRPTGSTVTLNNTNAQWTWFNPDVAGSYSLKLTVSAKETTITINAARYIGTDRHNLSGAQFNCASCHATFAVPQFFNTWKTSGHARMFEKGMNGENGSYWGSSCIKCHTSGYNLGAANGGADEAIASFGFVDSLWKPWRAGRYDSLLTTNKKLMTVFTGIGCEECHGPYNTAHFGAGTQPKSMKTDVCAKCHDALTHHVVPAQFASSGHANPIWSTSFRSSGSTVVSSWTFSACTRCHDGGAFVAMTKNGTFDNRASSGYQKTTQNVINCQTCHEPHSAGLRAAPAAQDTLANGFNYSSINLGHGKTCVNCHKYRRDGNVYPTTTNMSSHWGPHYAGAADLYLGKNAVTWGATIPTSIAHRLVENSCVGCHMSETPASTSPAYNKLGGHTWKMTYTPTGGAEIDNVSGCVGCHTGLTSFNQIIAAYDYDGNGVVEAFMTEVEGLKKKVAYALPPFGLDSVNRNMISANPDSMRLKQAFWNYLMVKYDGSHGTHNPKYVVGLLQNTVTRLTGVTFGPNEGVPSEFALSQNYPNPFNPTTSIQFSIPKSGDVRLEIYDISGRLVNTLVNENVGAGNYTANWNGQNTSGAKVASGVYLYRLAGEGFSMTKKMVLLK